MANYVLVHGGWFGGWCWDKVVPLLQAAGQAVYAPTLTGVGERAALISPDVGLDTHIQDVINLIETNDLEQVILVGHSYAGMVITGVADQVPSRIAQLIYLDAVVPRDGQSLADTLPLMGTMLQREANKNGDGWRVNPPGDGAFGIKKEPDLSRVRSKVTPQPLKTFLQPVKITHPDTLAAIPHTFVECTRRGLLIWLMRRILLRGSLRASLPNGPRWNRRTLASNHMAMILVPQALATLLLEFA